MSEEAEGQKAHEDRMKKKNVRQVYIWTGGFFLLFIVMLVLLRGANSSFTYGRFFTWLFGVALVLGGIAGGFHWWTYRNEVTHKEKRDKEASLPEPISEQAAYKIAIRKLSSEPFSDYVANVRTCASGQFGRSRRSSIFTLQGKGRYEKDVEYCVLVNQNYPDRTVVLRGASAQMVSKHQNLLAVDPEDDPYTEIIRRKNPLLGTEEEIERRGKEVREDKEAEKQKQEAL